ncbi:hypothetical protein HPP92_021252 [Vanilla planifolia]|uniref:Floricaula/leafy-like transcription factor n=1 Tax=Vanilla planifolia TaxID=51239 RepID=A0A835UKJ2_VANPL|nr:hypothetical protein HPP92_021614 [Vanilla planifolia]KAG0462776.1 hypothetical protein HPP92_021252 [Vanilla planifolia]
MDPGDAFSASLFRWDPRAAADAASAASGQPCPAVLTMALAASQQHQPHQHQPHDAPPQPTLPPPQAESARELEEVFEGYGVRYATVARIGDLGFTASTLVGMREEEVDDMMATLSHLFRWDLLVGERYGIKAAIRAERRRLEAVLFPPAVAAFGLSEEPVQLEREAAASGGEAAGRREGKWKNAQRRSTGGKKDAAGVLKKNRKKKKKGVDEEEEEEEEGWTRDEYGDEDDFEGEESESERSGAGERQREHPFIVTEPGEVARAKKNGLDYLFHLYEQCHEFLLQVQAVAKDRGDKCPTKVTNQVFRYAKKVGASYINKPKMRHYVHCYALHVLDEEASNALRRAFKERGRMSEHGGRPAISPSSRSPPATLSTSTQFSTPIHASLYGTSPPSSASSATSHGAPLAQSQEGLSHHRPLRRASQAPAAPATATPRHMVACVLTCFSLCCNMFSLCGLQLRILIIRAYVYHIRTLSMSLPFLGDHFG